MEKKKVSRAIIKYVITSILLKNPGKFNVIPAVGDGVILDTDLNANDVKLPKDCEIKINNTDTYRGSTIGEIYRKGQRIAAFWGKTKSNMSVREAKYLVDQLIELNDGVFDIEKRGKYFIIDTNMFLADIKFPEGVNYGIIYHPSEEDNSYQCQIIGNDNIFFPGIINCKAKKDDKVTFPSVLVDKKNSDEDDKNFVL